MTHVRMKAIDDCVLIRDDAGELIVTDYCPHCGAHVQVRYGSLTCERCGGSWTMTPPPSSNFDPGFGGSTS